MPKYSQVFLKDAGMCEAIATALGPEEFASGVEIGPGRGALTEFLVPLWGEKLSAVEIDPLMSARVKERFPGLKLINSDFLALDLETCFPRGPVAFVGNLPYECSTAILIKVLAFSRLGGAMFMFQREVAQKITAAVGAPDYGYLSVAVQAQSETAWFADVPASSFSPVPEVDSAVLVFRPSPFGPGTEAEDPALAPIGAGDEPKEQGKPRLIFPTAGDRKNFLNFVKSAFAHRRKTLENSLSMALSLDKTETGNRIRAAGFDPGLRPQNLSVADYLRLSSAFAAEK